MKLRSLHKHSYHQRLIKTTKPNNLTWYAQLNWNRDTIFGGVISLSHNPEEKFCLNAIALIRLDSVFIIDFVSMNVLESIIVLIVLTGFASAQFPGNKSCPENCRSHVENLTVDDIVGVWFSQVGIPTPVRAQFKCDILNFTKVDTYSAVMENTQTNIL